MSLTGILRLEVQIKTNNVQFSTILFSGKLQFTIDESLNRVKMTLSNMIDNYITISFNRIFI